MKSSVVLGIFRKPTLTHPNLEYAGIREKQHLTMPMTNRSIPYQWGTEEIAMIATVSGSKRCDKVFESWCNVAKKEKNNCMIRGSLSLSFELHHCPRYSGKLRLLQSFYFYLLSSGSIASFVDSMCLFAIASPRDCVYLPIPTNHTLYR